jgi:hypothetical protein
MNHLSIINYNALPSEYKIMNKKTFKREIKKFYKNVFESSNNW